MYKFLCGHIRICFPWAHFLEQNCWLKWFWGPTKLFSKVTAPFYIPTSNVGGLPFLHILSNTRLPVFYITAILMGTKCYLIVVWVCAPLKTSGVEGLFLCCLSDCISSLEKCLLRSFAYFQSGYLPFHCSIMSSLNNLIQVPKSFTFVSNLMLRMFYLLT